MGKPGNRPSRVLSPNPGLGRPQKASTLEEQEKDASDEVEQQPGSEVRVWDLVSVDSSPSLGCVI